MVKCRECGLLAIRNRITWSLDEVTIDMRSGQPHFQREHKKVEASPKTLLPIELFGENCVYQHFLYPICTQGCFDLKTEFDSSLFNIEDISIEELKPRQNIHDKKQFSLIISRDRECKEFLTYKPGYLPKERAEMEVIKLRTEYLDGQRRNDTRLRKIELFIVFLGVVTAATVSIVAALIERGIIFPEKNKKYKSWYTATLYATADFLYSRCSVVNNSFFASRKMKWPFIRWSSS